jgi:hypothetical protein
MEGVCFVRAAHNVGWPGPVLCRLVMRSLVIAQSRAAGHSPFTCTYCCVECFHTHQLPASLPTHRSCPNTLQVHQARGALNIPIPSYTTTVS